MKKYLNKIDEIADAIPEIGTDMKFDNKKAKNKFVRFHNRMLENLRAEIFNLKFKLNVI